MRKLKRRGKLKLWSDGCVGKASGLWEERKEKKDGIEGNILQQRFFIDNTRMVVGPIPLASDARELLSFATLHNSI